MTPSSGKTIDFSIGGTTLPIHAPSQDTNSRRLVCRLPYSPAPWPPYGRPETSRLLKVDHYLSRTGIMVRSSQYAAPRQDADAGEGVVTSSRGSVCYQRSYCPDTDVRMSRFEPLSYLLGPWAIEGSFVSYKGFQGAF